jgi:uncharacterized protein (DUF488 family)
MRIYTIGFTQHSAEDFFEKLKDNGVKRVIDIRINKTSQLAGFAKGNDLPYLLKVAGGIDYVAHSELAPTKELLKSYRSKEISWDVFEHEYIRQIVESKAIEGLDPAEFDDACLLCSEHTADKCHRRLLSQLLANHWHTSTIHL